MCPEARGRAYARACARPAPPAGARGHRPRGGRALAPRGTRRRHDAARQAALEARPGRRRTTRGAPAEGLRAALGDERQDDDRRDGGRDPPRQRAPRAQRIGRQPRLRRRVHPALVRAGPSSGCSRSTRPPCPRSPSSCGPRVLALGNLFRDQLDRYGELELVAERWRAARARAAGGRPARRERRRPAARRPRARAARRGRLRRRRSAPCSPRRPPARCRLEALRPLRRRRTSSTRPTSAISATTSARACGHRRPPLDDRGAGDRAERARVDVVRARHARRASRRDHASACPGSTTSTTRSPPRRSLGRSARALDEVVAGLERFSAAFGRFERIPIGDRTLLMLLIKNPAGTNEAIRTLVAGDAPSLAVVALNDAIADGKDVSWIWDVDFEPLLDGLDRVVATGDRAAELALRFKYGGFDPDAIEVVPSLGARARPRARADAAGRRARRPADVHGDARAAADRHRARARRPVLGARRVKIVVGHLYPEYLNIYADRGNIAVLERRAAWRGYRARRAGDLRGRRRSSPARTTSSTSAAGRTASRRSWRHDLARKGERLLEAARRRRGRARRLRRLPAPRPLLPRSPTARSCRASASSRTTRSRASGG